MLGVSGAGVCQEEEEEESVRRKTVSPVAAAWEPLLRGDKWSVSSRLESFQFDLYQTPASSG